MAAATLPHAPTATGTVVPPLVDGDLLDQPEFHRRYAASPDHVRAQLVEGRVYMAASTRLDQHGSPHGRLATWLGVYASTHEHVDLEITTTLILDTRNEVDPDLMLIRVNTPDAGVRITPDGYATGSPELVVEIAASSARLDLGKKKDVYARNGAQEYLVWETGQGRIHWFRLVDGEYRDIEPGPDGILESRIFPGLRLDVEALLRGDMKAVLRTLDG